MKLVLMLFLLCVLSVSTASLLRVSPALAVEDVSATSNDTDSGTTSLISPTANIVEGIFRYLEGQDAKRLVGMIVGILMAVIIIFIVWKFQGIFDIVRWLLIIGAVLVIFGVILVVILKPDILVQLGIINQSVNDSVTGEFVRRVIPWVN